MSISSSINIAEGDTMTTETVHETEAIHEQVRERYAEAARQVAEGGCCADSDTIGPRLYSALERAELPDAAVLASSALERAELPDAAVLASLGCGNPIAV